MFRRPQQIYDLSKRFPVEERYSLTDQIRRASRSVCSNIGEAWRKRRYPSAFVSKLSDADAEAAETGVWLDFALACKFISENDHRSLRSDYELINRQLCKMMDHPEDWCAVASNRSKPDK